MAKPLPDGQAYSGRRQDRAVVNCTMDREAAVLLRQYASGKALGSFIARLVFEHHSRRLAREELREKLAVVLQAEEE